MTFKLSKGSGIDLSKHKQMEKLRKKHSDHLEKLIKERTKELEAVNEQLEQGIKQRKKAEEKLRLNELRLEALLKLNQMTLAITKEISNFAIEEGVKLTGSSIGFFGFIEEHESKQIMSVYTWSKQAMKKCAMKDNIPVFYMDGVWNFVQRKKGEEPLCLSEERFSKVFFSSPVPMIIISIHNGKYMLANESFFYYTGYCLEEIINRPERELNILIPDYYKKISQAYRKGAVRSLEIKYRTKWGEERTALFSADLIDIQGNECLLCSGVDITELRRYEKEIARLERLNLLVTV